VSSGHVDHCGDLIVGKVNNQSYVLASHLAQSSSVIMAWLLLLLGLMAADKFSHTYSEDGSVTVWFNKAVSQRIPMKHHPFDYYSLCRGESSLAEDKHPLSFGEIFESYEMWDSHMDVHFRRDIPKTPLCSM